MRAAEFRNTLGNCHLKMTVAGSRLSSVLLCVLVVKDPITAMSAITRDYGDL